MRYETSPDYLAEIVRDQLHLPCTGQMCIRDSGTTDPVDLGDIHQVLTDAAEVNQLRYAFGNPDSGQGFWPVSYTHLDVYKRQSMRPASASRRPAPAMERSRELSGMLQPSRCV